jgi:hypothetical protein
LLNSSDSNSKVCSGFISSIAHTEPHASPRTKSPAKTLSTANIKHLCSMSSGLDYFQRGYAVFVASIASQHRSSAEVIEASGQAIASSIDGVTHPLSSPSLVRGRRKGGRTIPDLKRVLSTTSSDSHCTAPHMIEFAKQA